MEKIVELRNKAKALLTELETLSAKGHDLAPGDTARITQILEVEEPAVRAAIDAENTNIQRHLTAQGRAADLRSYLGDPADNANGRGNNRPHPGMRQDNSRGGNPAARTIAYSAAGETFLREVEGGGVEVTNTGYGLLQASKYAKINTETYNDAFIEYVQRGGRENMMSAANVRALQEGIDDQGGYLVPPEMALRLIQRQPTPTSLSPYFFSWQTARDAVIFPKVQYTGAGDDPNATLYTTGVRVSYPGELPNDQKQIDSTQPSFGETRIEVFTAMMALDVSRNMIDDSPIGTMAFIESKLRETAMLEYDNRGINGTGVNQASGIIGGSVPVAGATSTSAPQYIPSGAASALTADGIKAILFNVAPQYLMNARWAMSWMSAAQAINELKDGQGRYLWSDGLQDNGLSASVFERRLLGLPSVYSEFFPAVAANAFPLIFGDLMGYYMVQRLGLSIQILFETKAKQNMLEVVARMRFGGQLAEPWRIKVQKVSVS